MPPIVKTKLNRTQLNRFFKELVSEMEAIELIQLEA